jgi:hypothetical protein
MAISCGGVSITFRYATIVPIEFGRVISGLAEKITAGRASAAEFAGQFRH